MSSEGRHYQVLSVLGRGGFGTVYRARLSTDGGFSKVVALKVLNADMEGVAEMAQRMRDEARVLGLVNHRAIVQVDALVLLDGKWTVVMEYVEGADLKSLLNKGPIPLGPTLEVARELAGALDFAFHEKGPDGQPLKLLHRDIKPGNVRVTPAGEVKLLDFGIARADFQSREAHTRALSFGTPDYMSPERFEFVDGPEGDVYAVGVLLFEMLTGEHFGQTSLSQERHDARVMAALDKLWQATSGRSEDLVRFVGSILAYDPAARPSAREVERRCTELWRTLGEQTLRDWVETVLPTLTRQEEEAAPGDLTSRKLTENIRSGAIPYPTEKLEEPPMTPPRPPVTSTPSSSGDMSSLYADPPPPKKGGAGIFIVLALFVLLVVAGGAAVGGWYYYTHIYKSGGDDVATTDQTSTDQTSGQTTTSGQTSGDQTATTTTATDASSSGTTQTTGTTSTDQATTTTATTTDDGKTTAATTTDDGKTTAATTTDDGKTTDGKTTDGKTTATSTKKHTGKVTVVGDAYVRLIRGGTRVEPSNEVPAGTYTLQYKVAGDSEMHEGGRVVVPEGGSVNIVCSRGARTCKAR